MKCHQYWPSYGSAMYGSFQVTLRDVENLAEYSVRSFSVQPVAGTVVVMTNGCHFYITIICRLLDQLMLRMI